jgi:hypothetical protein
MSKIEVDAIDKQSGSTLTIGGSGTTVQLGTGASQTGFGRTGTVDWQTTIKTGDFTAVSGEGYFINTTSGAITMTLPSSPSAGDIVAVKDYANTFDSQNLTINRNGSNISGDASNPVISTEGQALTLVYGDATKGWQAVYAATEADLPKPKFVTATGGTETTVCTNFKVHTFTGPGTFTVSCAGNPQGSSSVDYLIIAGGGGGGGGYQSGGGGAGGYRESPGSASGCYAVSPRGAAPAAAVPVTASSFPIVVGGGGAGGGAVPAPDGPNGNRGTDGVNSSALGLTSAGGGSGGGFRNASPATIEIGNPGGSGGGAGRSPATVAGGTGNTPPVNPVQGTNGGGTSPPYGSPYNGGSGGGAITAGGASTGSCVGVGGNGATSSINGTPTARAGGGGSGGCGPASTGGPGGGGNGGSPSGGNAANGTTNTGGGGGGGQINPAIPCSGGGNGGSGIVIIRYKFQ